MKELELTKSKKAKMATYLLLRMHSMSLSDNVMNPQGSATNIFFFPTPRSGEGSFNPLIYQLLITLKRFHFPLASLRLSLIYILFLGLFQECLVEEKSQIPFLPK